MGLCLSLHGKNLSLKIMMVVGGGGGGVSLVTFNSRRPLPSAGITLKKNRIILPKSVDFPRVSASVHNYCNSGYQTERGSGQVVKCPAQTKKLH